MDSTLMKNSYYPYGNLNHDVLSIVENEKQLHKKNKKELTPPITIESISDDVMYVIYKTFDDIFNKNVYSDLLNKDRRRGIGYICIIIYMIYILNKI